MAIPMERGLSEATPSTARFSVGDLVEVKQTEFGLRGSWHPGVVIKVGHRTRVVRFDELFTDDFSKQLEETVTVSAIADGEQVEAREESGEATPPVAKQTPPGSQNGHGSGKDPSGAGEARPRGCCSGLLIRPRPPKAAKPYASQWRVGTPVEMFQNDAWWEGLLLQDMKDKTTVHGEPVVHVHFPDENTSELVPTKYLRHGLTWCEHTDSWTMRSTMGADAAAQVESARKRRRVNLPATDEEPLKLSPLIFSPQAKPPGATAIKFERGSNGTFLSPTREKTKSTRIVVKQPSKLPKKLTKILAGDSKNGCTPSRETEARKMSKAVLVGQQFADLQRSMLAEVGSLGEDVLELEAEAEDEKVTVKRRGRPRGDGGAGANGGPRGSGGKGKPRLVQGKKMVKGAPGRQQLRVKSDPVENTPLAKVRIQSPRGGEDEGKVEPAEVLSPKFEDLMGDSAGGRAAQRPPHYAREVALLVEAGMLKDGQKVAYRDAKTKEDLVTAVVSGGCCFVCLCCNISHNLSSLEAHTGKTYRRPAKNTWVEDGRSIADLKNELLSMRLARGELEPVSLTKKAQKNSAGDSLAVDFSALPPVPGDYSDELCRMCGEGGELLCCDSCPATLHLQCVGLEAVPEGDWYCPMCRCSLCGLSHFQAEGFGDNTIIFCDQCTRQYHVSCLREAGRADLKRLPKGEWFCSSACRKVFKGLRGLVGQTIPLQEDYYVSILREGWDPTALGAPGGSLGSPPPPKAPASTLDPASKRQLSMALEVMQECFHPIKDAYTQVDLIPFIVRSGKTPTRDCSNFYTFLLGKGKDAITVASVRVYGAEVAEMPLIGTRFTFRRQGMCRRLMNELEKLLANLGVNKLVLPAVPEAYDTWKGAFGFDNVPREVRRGLLPLDIMLFPGAEILEKPLNPKRRSKALMRLMPFSAEAAHQQGAMAQAADAALEMGPGTNAGSLQPPARASPDLMEGELALGVPGAAGDSVDIMATPLASYIGHGVPGAQDALWGSVEGGMSRKGAGRNGQLLGAALVDAWHTGASDDVGGEGAEHWEPSSPWGGPEFGNPPWLGRGEDARMAGSPVPRPKDPWAVPVLPKKGKGAKDALRAYQRRARDAGGEMPLGLLVGYTGIPWKQLTPWWERKGEGGVCQGHDVARYLTKPPFGPAVGDGAAEESLTWLQDLADLIAVEQHRGGQDGGVSAGGVPEAVVALEATESKEFLVPAGMPRDALVLPVSGVHEAQGDVQTCRGRDEPGGEEQAATGDGRQASGVLGLKAPNEGEEEEGVGRSTVADTTAAAPEETGKVEEKALEGSRSSKAVAGSGEKDGLGTSPGECFFDTRQELDLPEEGAAAAEGATAPARGARGEGIGAEGAAACEGAAAGESAALSVEARAEEAQGVPGVELQLRSLEPCAGGTDTGSAELQDPQEIDGPAAMDVPGDGDEHTMPSSVEAAGGEPLVCNVEGADVGGAEAVQDQAQEQREGSAELGGGDEDMAHEEEGTLRLSREAQAGGSTAQGGAQGIGAFTSEYEASEATADVPCTDAGASEATTDGAPRTDADASEGELPRASWRAKDAAEAPGVGSEEQERNMAQPALVDEVPETPEPEEQQEEQKEEQEKRGEEIPCSEERQGGPREVSEGEVKEERGKEGDRPEEKEQSGGHAREEDVQEKRGRRAVVERSNVVEGSTRGSEAQPVRRETRRSLRGQGEGAATREEEPVGKETRRGVKSKGDGEKQEATAEEGAVVTVSRSSSLDGSWDAVSGGEKFIVLCLPAANSAEASAMGRKGKGRSRGVASTPSAHSSGATGLADTPGPWEATDTGASHDGAPSPDEETREDKAGKGEGGGEEREVTQANPKVGSKGARDTAGEGGKRGSGVRRGRGPGLKKGQRQGQRRSSRLVEVGLAGSGGDRLRQGMSPGTSKFRKSPRLLRIDQRLPCASTLGSRPGSTSGASRDGRKSVRLNAIVSPAKGSSAKPTPGTLGSVKAEPGGATSRGGPVKKSLFSGRTSTGGAVKDDPGASGIQVKLEGEGASGGQAGQAAAPGEGGKGGAGPGLGLSRKRKRGRKKWYHDKTKWRNKREEGKALATAEGEGTASRKLLGHRSKVRKSERLEASGLRVGPPGGGPEAGPGAEEEGKGRRTLRLTLRGESIAEGLVGARAVAPLRPGEEGAYDTTPGSRGKGASTLSPVDFASLEVACWDGCEEEMEADVHPLQGVMRLARMFGFGALTQAVPVEVVSRARPSGSQTSGGSSWLQLPVEPASRGVSRTGELGHMGEGAGEGEGGRACGEEGVRARQGQWGVADTGGGVLGKRKRDREGVGVGLDSDEEEVDSVSCARTQGTPPAVLREKKSPQAGPRKTRGALLRAGLATAVGAEAGAPAKGGSTQGTPTSVTGPGGTPTGKASAQGVPRGRTKKELAAARKGVPLNGLSQGSPPPSAARASGQDTPTVDPAAAAPAAPEDSRGRGAAAEAFCPGEEGTEQGQAGEAGPVEGKEDEEGKPPIVNGTGDLAAHGVPGTALAGEEKQAEPREEAQDSACLILPGCGVGPTLAWKQTSVSVPVVYRGARAKAGALADQSLVAVRGSFKGAGRGRLGSGSGNGLRPFSASLGAPHWGASLAPQEDGGLGGLANRGPFTPLSVSTTGAVVGEGSWGAAGTPLTITGQKSQGSLAVRALEPSLSAADAEKERERMFKVTAGGKGPGHVVGHLGHARPAVPPEEGVKWEPEAGPEGAGEGLRGTAGVPGVAGWEVGGSPLGRGSPLTLQQLAARRKRSHTAMKRHMWVGSVIGEEEGEGEQHDGDTDPAGATTSIAGIGGVSGGGGKGEGASGAGVVRKRKHMEGQGRGAGSLKRELVIAQQSKDREARHALRLQRMDGSIVSTDDEAGAEVEGSKGRGGPHGEDAKGSNGADSVKLEPGVLHNSTVTAAKEGGTEGDKHTDERALVTHSKLQRHSDPTGSSTGTSLDVNGDGALLFSTPQKGLAVYERQRKVGSSPRPRLKAFQLPKGKASPSVLGTPRDSRHSKTAACTFEDSDSSLLKLEYDELLF